MLDNSKQWLAGIPESGFPIPWLHSSIRGGSSLSGPEPCSTPDGRNKITDFNTAECNGFKMYWRRRSLKNILKTTKIKRVHEHNFTWKRTNLLISKHGNGLFLFKKCPISLLMWANIPRAHKQATHHVQPWETLILSNRVENTENIFSLPSLHLLIWQSLHYIRGICAYHCSIHSTYITEMHMAHMCET